jgi:hypothetical protein
LETLDPVRRALGHEHVCVLKILGEQFPGLARGHHAVVDHQDFVGHTLFKFLSWRAGMRPIRAHPALSNPQKYEMAF